MSDVSPEADALGTIAAEREEVERVLRSPLFQRAPKLSRILSYLCEERFNGNAHEIKEYSIAVEALGRPESFDPQTDAIVRVDLHLLRKRLKAYYTGVGATDELEVMLPSGSYVIEFVPRKPLLIPRPEEPEVPLELSTAVLPEVSSLAVEPVPPALPATQGQPLPRRSRRMRGLLIGLSAGAVVGLVVGSLLVAGWVRRSSWLLLMPDMPRPVSAVTAAPDPGSAADTLLQGIRIRCGTGADYVDTNGLNWQGDRYFTGGIGYHRAVSTIYRSPDAPLFLSGREGVFQYDVPAPAGIYELHLFFAETKPGIEDLMREVSFSIGEGAPETVDIVSDAHGTDTATERVYANLRPDYDGRIHIKFLSSDSMLSALELLPQSGRKPLPVRIAALPGLYTDRDGRHWMSDRYFLGGRNQAHLFPHGTTDPPLLLRERYGTFDYDIPVAAGFKYKVTLYMTEDYWGPHNSGFGGPGSRLFTVRCNGVTLLSNFDLLGAQKDYGGVIARFGGLQPDNRGKLDLQFIPVVNYALVNAIAVDPE